MQQSQPSVVHFCDYVTVYSCKEIENFLLVPAAIDRAAAQMVADQAKRAGSEMNYSSDAAALIDNFASEKKSYITAQYLAERKRYERINSPTLHEASINIEASNEIETCWSDTEARLKVIPGKEALADVQSTSPAEIWGQRNSNCHN